MVTPPSKHKGPKVFSILPEYYDAIKDGRKIYEGRIASCKTLKEYQNGGQAILRCHGRADLLITIESAEHFETFRQMLRGREELFLPGIDNLQAAVKVYHSFNWYKYSEGKQGAMALKIASVEECPVSATEGEAIDQQARVRYFEQLSPEALTAPNKKAAGKPSKAPREGPSKAPSKKVPSKAPKKKVPPKAPSAPAKAAASQKTGVANKAPSAPPKATTSAELMPPPPAPLKRPQPKGLQPPPLAKKLKEEALQLKRFMDALPEPQPPTKVARPLEAAPSPAASTASEAAPAQPSTPASAKPSEAETGSAEPSEEAAGTDTQLTDALVEDEQQDSLLPGAADDLVALDGSVNRAAERVLPGTSTPEYRNIYRRFLRAGKNRNMPPELIEKFNAKGLARNNLFKLWFEAGGNWAIAQIQEKMTRQAKNCVRDRYGFRNHKQLVVMFGEAGAEEVEAMCRATGDNNISISI